MNAKNFLTVAMVVYLLYGLWYFFAPASAIDVYGMTSESSSLSNAFLQYIGASLIGGGVMCAMARNAGESAGLTAVLAYIAVSSLVFLYLNVTGMDGSAGLIDWIDMAVNALLGLGAIYLIMQGRKSTRAVAGAA